MEHQVLNVFLCEDSIDESNRVHERDSILLRRKAKGEEDINSLNQWRKVIHIPAMMKKNIPIMKKLCKQSKAPWLWFLMSRGTIGIVTMEDALEELVEKYGWTDNIEKNLLMMKGNINSREHVFEKVFWFIQFKRGKLFFSKYKSVDSFRNVGRSPKSSRIKVILWQYSCFM